MEIKGYWLASGILGVTASVLRRVHESGADVVVTKSIGPVPRVGHPGPICTSSHGGLINAVGLTNPGIDAFLDELHRLGEWGVPFVLSVFGRSPQEAASVASRGVEAKPLAIELNLSCPHAEIGQVAHDPDLTFQYVRAVKDAVDCPVFAKLTPNASDITSVGRAAERAGADAVVAINTVRAMRIDIVQRRPILGNLVGGLSGPPVFPIAVRAVYDLYASLSVPIIGVGGVTTWQDAVEMHLAGASAIEIGTGVLSGLDVFSRVREGVMTYVQETGFSDIADIVGLAQRR